MKTKRFKIAGFVILSLVMIVVMASCDSGTSDEATVESLGTLGNITIDYGTDDSEVLEVLREEYNEVDVNLSDGSTATGDVAWDTVPDDFDGTAEGESFDFEGNVTYDGTVLNETVTVEVIIGDEPLSDFRVNINEDASILEADQGDDFSINITVENIGEAEGTQDIIVTVDGIEVASEEVVNLGAGLKKQ